MDLNDFFGAMRVAYYGTLPLDVEQQKALTHQFDIPLWIIAGPGTGKTHTLVWLVLKRLLVDGIAPNRIFLTTFTRKAAAELESRLILSRQKLVAAGITEAADVDITQMNIGTLHGLCARVLQDQRYDPTLRIRVLEDELTQQFFLRTTHNPLINHDSIAFWARFGMVDLTSPFPPNKAKRAEGAAKLFNRMTENSVDVGRMLASGDADFVRLGESYQTYQQDLANRHRTDQAHLQQHFLSFLTTSAGQTWLGRGFATVVDEYQDTNPIQESIYFTLAGSDGDLTVVGDDDQSLYRFRGATVESLIDFDSACLAYLGKAPVPVYLYENRRSHPMIVEWVNRFIENHPEMQDPSTRVRAPGKRRLDARSTIEGPYPAVMAIVEKENPAAAKKLVQAIQDLMDDGRVQDYSQIALLTFSTRETSHAIGTFTKAMKDVGIPLYNPRNKSAQKDRLLLAMVGGLSAILDPDAAILLPAPLSKDVTTYLTKAREAFKTLVDSGSYPELEAYVDNSVAAIAKASYHPVHSTNYLRRSGGRRVTLGGLLYKLLAQEPFASQLADAEGGERLKALNLVLAEYESLFDEGELKITADAGGTCQIEPWTLYNFYAVFVEGIHDGLNDPEDDETSIQPGMINVMTIHQSKGLEFEVVFVLRPDKQPFESDTHILEDELDPYISRPTKPARRPRHLRAAEDTIRLFFVAYSRAKRLLVLVGSKIEAWDRVLGLDDNGAPLTTKEALQKMEVHIL